MTIVRKGMRRSIAAIVLLGAGWALAPVGIALVRAATSPDTEQARLDAGLRLVDAMGVTGEQYRANLTIMPDYGPVKACGHDPAKLFSDRTGPTEESPEWGYDTLQRDDSEQRSKVLPGLQAFYLGDSHGVLQLQFLAECMERTAFAPLCRSRAQQLLAGLHGTIASELKSATASVQQTRKAILCTYLDGVELRQQRNSTKASGSR